MNLREDSGRMIMGLGDLRRMEDKGRQYELVGIEMEGGKINHFHKQVAAIVMARQGVVMVRCIFAVLWVTVLLAI
jgi:hypothetical protein